MIAAMIVTLKFQSTLPCEGATDRSATPARSRPLFQSTLPCEGATPFSCQGSPPYRVSIHAPVRGSDAQIIREEYFRNVSIHAPVRGSDLTPSGVWRHLQRFNPRSRARERQFCRYLQVIHTWFQSTLPCEGATLLPEPRRRSSACFNPRSRARERHIEAVLRLVAMVFQSTLPCEGATEMTRETIRTDRFQSTLPCEGATTAAGDIPYFSDTFQSTLPCEGATLTVILTGICLSFQSTLPCEGATRLRCQGRRRCRVSIHAPVRGSDRLRFLRAVPIWCFNPRSRARERQRMFSATLMPSCFNPRSRARERPSIPICL